MEWDPLNSTQRYLTGQLAAKGLAAATFVVLARTVPTAAVGRFVSALLVASLLSVIINFGRSQVSLRIAATGHLAATQPFLRTRVNICRFLIASGLALTLVLRGNTDGALAGLTVALGALLTLNAFREGQFLGSSRGGLAAGANLLSNIVTLGTSLIIGLTAAGHANAAMIVASFAGGAACANGLYMFAGRRSVERVPAVSVAATEHQPGGREGIFHRRLVGGLNLTSFLYYRADLLTLSLLAPAKTVAIYAAAYRLFEMIPVLLQLAGVARQPAAAREIKSGSPSLAARETYTGLVLLGLVLAAALLAIGSIAVHFLFGARYGDATMVLLFLIPGGFGQALNIAAYTCIASAGSLDQHRAPLIMTNLVSVPVVIFGIVVGRHLLGLQGVAFAQSIVELLVGVSLTMLISSEFKIRVRWFALRMVSLVIAGPIVVVLTTYWRFFSVVPSVMLIPALVAKNGAVRRIVRTW